MAEQIMEEQSYEEFARSVHEEHREELEAFEKSAQRGLFTRTTSFAGSTAVGVGAGLGNAAADLIDTTTDMAIYAGVGYNAGLAKLFGVGKDVYDHNQTLQDVQSARDKMTSYIRANESDDGVRDFAMNVTESIAKFALFYKAIGPRIGSKAMKAMVAGAGEGFTDDPQREMVMMDKALRMAVQGVAPDAVADFDKAMDLSTDPTVSQQLIKRVMAAVDIGLLSAAGEKLFDVAGAGVKAGVKHLPDGMKESLRDGLGQVMDRWRKTKEYVSGAGKQKTLNDYILTQGETKFALTAGRMTPEASAKENLRNSIQVQFDSSVKTTTPEQYSARLLDYEKKLEALAPKIKAEIVSMAKSRGLAEKEELAKFARQLGVEEADLLTEEGLKSVLRAQGHNIMLEQEATSFVMASGNFKRGVVKESEYLEAAKSLHTVIQQRMAHLTGAGRTLRTAQEIPAALQKINKEIVASGRTLDDVIAAYGKTIDDPDALRVMAKNMDDVMASHAVMGDSADEIMKSMAKALKSVDPKKSTLDIARDVGNAVGAIYQANLLSATWTLSQNTFGSASMMFMRATEGLIEAGVGQTLGRHEGSATFREAMIQYNHMVAGHWDAMFVSAKAARKMAQGKAGEAGEIFRQKMTDIPEMTAKEREFMFRMRKEDMKAREGTINDAISSNVYTSFLAGRPIFDFIQLQDITTKSAAARAYMRGRYDTAVYVDDVLGIGIHTTDKQARQILDTMFKEGRDVFDPAELKALGLSKRDAIDVSDNLAKWRSKTSKEAVDYGVDAALQTPLKGAMKDLQRGLQDTIPFGRVLVPFFNTPVNIVNETLRRMPMIQIGEDGALGLPVHPDFYTDFMAGGRKRQQAISRAVSGMAITQLGMTMAENGSMIHVPTDKSVAQGMDTLFDLNPGSIVIGGKSYPVMALGPIGLLLNYGAGLHASNDRQDQIAHLSDEEQQMFSDALLSNVASFMQIVREAPYAQALDDLVSIFEFDPEDEAAVGRAQEYMSRLVGNMVPYSSLQRQVGQNFQEERTRAHGVWEAFRQSFAPYLNTTAYNAFSETMQPTRGVLARSKRVNDDALTMKIAQEANRLPRPPRFEQIFPGTMGDPDVKVKLSPEQWDEFNTIVRDEENLRKRLEETVRLPSFVENVARGMYNDNGKEIDSVINNARRRALDKLYSRDRTLQDTIIEERKKRSIDLNIRQTLPPTFGGN